MKKTFFIISILWLGISSVFAYTRGFGIVDMKGYNSKFLQYINKSMV